MSPDEMNRYWKKIINTMNEGLLLVATDGTIISVNRAFESMTGYRKDEVIGQSCTLLECDACEKALKIGSPAWCSLFANERDISKRCIIRKKDGTYLYALKNATILLDDHDRPVGAVETITNLSEMERLDKEIEHLCLHFETGFHGIVGESPVMKRLFAVIEKAAASDAPVIIRGESGTGKELVAMAIHALGRRREGPFIQLNCAALNESLLESELFGHTKGSFTGAYRHRIGRFEAADGGDIFLDEIGDMPLSIQVKLLRVLESKKFERVGDHRPISVDVRIITATHKKLEELIESRKFREDFFYRINVLPIEVPSLRSRKDDIPILIQTFIRRLGESSGKEIVGLSKTAMDRFMEYNWPGNVRELKSALEYAFVIASGKLITEEDLPPVFAGKEPEAPLLAEQARDGLWGRKEAAEMQALIGALRQSGGNQSQAARLLGVNRVTVWNRMKKYGIERKTVVASRQSS